MMSRKNAFFFSYRNRWCLSQNLLETIRMYEVKCLEMVVHSGKYTDLGKKQCNIFSPIFFSVNVLLELSSLLASLRIEALSIFNRQKLFKISNNVWTNVFPEMLSRKLEKLSIHKLGDFLDMESAVIIGKVRTETNYKVIIN